jgi:hypothetical protein
MNLTPNETLNKLMKMPSQAFTVEELKYLITLSYPYPLGYEKNVERIYNRLREVPPEAGGLAGGYLQ